ncbi:hypothetical protein GGI35DRAFT_455206 [Trichoderma velutinum]
MPFWDENVAYCLLIGQKPPPPPRVDGGAMHIYNICMLMQRHNRKSNLPSKSVVVKVVTTSYLSKAADYLVRVTKRRCQCWYHVLRLMYAFAPSLAHLLYLDTPRLPFGCSSWRHMA